jgi:hypothetical protein
LAKQNTIFLNGDHCEEKKRDPRFLEEKKRATASFSTRPHQAPAAGAAPGTTGQSGKAAGHFNEVGTPGILIGSLMVGVESLQQWRRA